MTMKTKAILLLLAVLFTLGMSYSCSDDTDTPPVVVPEPEPEPEPGSNKYELSYWVDIDLRVSNGRGYWFKVGDYAPDITPTAAQVEQASKSLRNEFHGNKLYIVYHRQFELEEAKTTLAVWKNWGDQLGMEIVPAIVLQDYTADALLNFTDEEIVAFADWCKTNVNDKEFGIYDVYIRHQSGSVQDMQIAKIKERIGDNLVHVGLQPGSELNAHMKAAVEDTWTAECQGLTNELWENPVMFKGTDNYGRKLLEEWIKERADGENRRIVWDMIPVAWDYEAPVDSLGYICPGDDALINDPPIDGRIDLCHTYFVKNYPDGMLNPKFGGYSCDLHILEANSYGKPERPTFYDQLKANKPYKGYFASAMDQVASLYKSLR